MVSLSETQTALIQNRYVGKIGLTRFSVWGWYITFYGNDFIEKKKRKRIAHEITTYLNIYAAFEWRLGNHVYKDNTLCVRYDGRVEII